MTVVGDARRGLLLLRAALALLIVLFTGMADAAPVPQLSLPAVAERVQLTRFMVAQQVPADGALDPDVAWLGDPSVPLLEPSDRWRSSPGTRLVGRIVLQGGPLPSSWVVHVPTAWFDEVQVWRREPGGVWESQSAGDRVPLSNWPFKLASAKTRLPTLSGLCSLRMVKSRVSSLKQPSASVTRTMIE